MNPIYHRARFFRHLNRARNVKVFYLHPGSLYPKQYTTFFRRRILVNKSSESLSLISSKMSRGTNSILSEIEWDEGLSMPVANAENKALEDQVKPLKNAYVAIVG